MKPHGIKEEIESIEIMPVNLGRALNNYAIEKVLDHHSGCNTGIEFDEGKIADYEKIIFEKLRQLVTPLKQEDSPNMQKNSQKAKSGEKEEKKKKEVKKLFIEYIPQSWLERAYFYNPDPSLIEQEKRQWELPDPS